MRTLISLRRLAFGGVYEPEPEPVHLLFILTFLLRRRPVEADGAPHLGAGDQHDRSCNVVHPVAVAILQAISSAMMNPWCARRRCSAADHATADQPRPKVSIFAYAVLGQWLPWNDVLDSITRLVAAPARHVMLQKRAALGGLPCAAPAVVAQRAVGVEMAPPWLISWPM